LLSIFYLLIITCWMIIDDYLKTKKKKIILQ
jgi:succinate dehydrogenase hydrophobic anchor subunit